GGPVARESSDCGYAKNGVLIVARSDLELQGLSASIAEDRAWGFGPDDSVLLDAAQTQERIAAAGAVGSRFSPHCASIDPGALVRGLAVAAERAGATIYEETPVKRIEAGMAHTAHGGVRARFVVR